MLTWTPAYKNHPTEPGWYFIKMTTTENEWEKTETLPAKLYYNEDDELEWEIYPESIHFCGMCREFSCQIPYRRNKQTVYVTQNHRYNITHWTQVIFGG